MKYIKKPVVVEAFEFPGDDNLKQPHFENWANEVGFSDFTWNEDGTIGIDTMEGEMTASVGDYIIRGIEGEFYPCKPDIFHKSYAEYLEEV